MGERQPRYGVRGGSYRGEEPERFWEKVNKDGPTPTVPDWVHGPCWLWTGATDRYGYGNFHIKKNGKGYMDKAHRVAWRLGQLVAPPDGYCVMHKCDNPPCCNPAHLGLGSRGMNNKDRHAKGRTACGEQKPSHKVTEAEVREIRQRAAAGESRETLISAYGVSHMAISYIVRRITWKHVL